MPPLRRPETTKAFTYFALFNFIAVLQITNFYSCFIVVETKVQKSDFPKVTQLVSDGAGIYAQFDYQASLLSHHQNRSEFPLLLQAIGWKVQEESRRSPSGGRRCALPGGTGLADVLCSWQKEKKNAVTTMFSASLYNKVNNMFVLELCLIQIRAQCFLKGRQQHALFRGTDFFPISYSPDVTSSQNISHPYTATNENLELGSYTEGEHPLGK